MRNNCISSIYELACFPVICVMCVICVYACWILRSGHSLVDGYIISQYLRDGACGMLNFVVLRCCAIYVAKGCVFWLPQSVFGGEAIHS